MRAALKAVVVAFVLIVIVGWLTGGPPRQPGGSGFTLPEPRLAVEVRRTVAGIVITAQTSGLSECRLRLNGEWTASVPVLPPGVGVTVDFARMTLSDGRRFNVLTHAPQSLYVVCDRPSRTDASFRFN